MRKLAWAGVAVGTLLLLFLLLTSYLVSGGGLSISLLKSDEQPEFPTFRIGVLGDSQKGLANLRNVTRAVKNEKVSVMLHTGDLVSNNDDGHYALACRYLLMGGAVGMPYVAPGNHDLKGGSDRFTSICGERERSFTRRGVAIVLLDNAFGNPPPDPRHVEERIAAAGPHQAVVLAMHQPPFDAQGTPKPEYAAFLAWLEKSGVNYLLCGHVHAYLKKKVGETTVIINGVGGDYDKWQLNQKVYATILEVDGSKITDRTLEIEPVHELWENIEHLCIGHVGEPFRRWPRTCWAGIYLLFLGILGALVWLFRKPKNIIPTP